jgi:hypothetical protein
MTLNLISMMMFCNIYKLIWFKCNKIIRKTSIIIMINLIIIIVITIKFKIINMIKLIKNIKNVNY